MKNQDKKKKVVAAVESAQDAATHQDEPSYLKRLNATYMEDKVGQTFITFTSKRMPKTNKPKQGNKSEN